MEPSHPAFGSPLVTAETVAAAGGAAPADASSKMANTIAASNRLCKTYNPVNVVSVRRFDGARKVGRKQLREEQRPDKSPPESVTMRLKKKR